MHAHNTIPEAMGISQPADRRISEIIVFKQGRPTSAAASRRQLIDGADMSKHDAPAELYAVFFAGANSGHSLGRSLSSQGIVSRVF